MEDPTKPQVPKTSPKDFFLNLLSTVALYITSASFIILVFQYINIFFPDTLDSNSYSNPLRSAFDAIRFAVSTLVVAFPVYVASLWYMNKEYVNDPEKRKVRIRKWLVYFTLFLAAVIIMGNFVTLVYTFLNGDITIRFILKVITLLTVIGSIFGYYFHDLKKYKIE